MVWTDGYPDNSLKLLETQLCLYSNKIVGKRAAVGYHSGTIRVIDLKTETVVSTLAYDPDRSYGHSSVVTTLDCYTDNNLLISASLEGMTILSSANNGKVKDVYFDICTNKIKTSYCLCSIRFMKRWFSFLNSLYVFWQNYELILRLSIAVRIHIYYIASEEMFI